MVPGSCIIFLVQHPCLRNGHLSGRATDYAFIELTPH